MVRYQAKKFVVVCFLEAAKTVIDHLGQYRMHLAQEGQEGPKDLVATYSDIRRLRDYLQRCLGAFTETVEFNIGPSDQALLVACTQRAVEVLDLHLDPTRSLRDEEREWLLEKRRVLSDWTVALAQKPMVELPLPRLNAVHTAGINVLNARITLKLRQRPAAEVNAPASASGPMAPLDPMQALEAAAGNSSRDAMVPLAVLPLAEPIDPSANEAEPPGGEPPGLPATASAPAWPGHPSSSLVDTRHVHDPRLRALMALDLRAFERAIGAHDYRLAAVHLSSIMEGAVTDHAIPRRAELGLVGAPDSWNPQEILMNVMGDLVALKDRGVVYQVFAARNLIRPAAQLVAPAAVTSRSLDMLIEFARRALRHMGFQTCGEQAAQPRAQATSPADGQQTQAGA
jgi:hypothetical protein